MNAAQRDSILTDTGSMAPNFFPIINTTRTPRNPSLNSPPLYPESKFNMKNDRRKPQQSAHDFFLESRQALMDGDTGMSQILLTKTVDDKSYGMTQYAFDMVFIYSTMPVGILSTSKSQRIEGGRMGQLSHLKSILNYDGVSPMPPLHVMHSRSFFNSSTGQFVVRHSIC